MLEKALFRFLGEVGFFAYRMLLWLLRLPVKYVGPFFTGVGVALLTLFGCAMVMACTEVVLKPLYGEAIFAASVPLVVAMVVLGLPMTWGAIAEVVEELE